MKKKGFTLIELIVVIAIIGVLAAILVPAMLGYVKKSKITTANTTAKSIYNAYNSALTDLDSEDWKITVFASSETNFTDTGNSTRFNDNITVGTNKTTNTGVGSALRAKVNTYFSDIQKVGEFCWTYKSGGCTAVAVLSGAYPGTYPHAMTVDAYSDATWSLGQAISWAQNTTLSSQPSSAASTTSFTW